MFSYLSMDAQIVALKVVGPKLTTFLLNKLSLVKAMQLYIWQFNFKPYWKAFNNIEKRRVQKLYDYAQYMLKNIGFQINIPYFQMYILQQSS